MLSQRLKMLRESKGLTQAELSEALHVAPSTVGMYEIGRRKPDYDSLKRIAEYFQTSPNELIGWKGSNPVSDPEASLLDQFRLLNPNNKVLVSQLINSLAHQQALNA